MTNLELRELCCRYDLNFDKARMRMKLGWSLEEILEITTWHDHLNKEYSNLKEMCDAYGITVDTFKRRLYAKWDIKKILTYKKPNVSVEDHLGNKYSSQKEMCRDYQIDCTTFRTRIEKGIPLEKALTMPVRHNRQFYVSDHEGNVFHNISEMCEHWGIKRSTYGARKRAGWSIEDILTTPLCFRYRIVEDPISGTSFNSFRALCLQYQINPRTVRSRIENGMDLETALLIPPEERVFKTFLSNLNEMR